MDRYPLIIGNNDVVTSSTMEVRSPYDSRTVGEVCIAGGREIDSALQIAQSSSKGFARSDLKFRISILEQADRLLGERAEEFAQTITAESGKPIREARVEVSRARETLRLSAHAALEHMGGKVLPLSAASNGADKWGFCQRFGVGTVVAITPFNFPLNLAAHKIGPAIAAGNSFILKPAEKTPISGVLFGRLLVEAGMPNGTVNVLNGLGPLVGEPLTRDERVRVVTFTGSPRVGVHLSSLCGLKLSAFELGSNSAVYIHSDAELMRSADRIVAGGFSNAGQVCISTQRVYAHHDVYQQLIDLLLVGIRALKVGDPSDEATVLGPMISREASDRAFSWLERAVSRGAKVLIGGARDGTLFQPTLVADVPDDCELCSEEVFAPIVTIASVSGAEEALMRIEDTKYGLHAGIFTQDIELARKAFERLEVGGVIINDIPTFRADLIPYGGTKLSGIGREGPEFALEHMTYWKNFIVHKCEIE